MADDLSNSDAWERNVQFRLDRLESGAMLENGSVSHGRLRFIGGLLLIDSGGTLQVVGHFNGDGDFVWNGPWAFTGAGEITGDVDITGDLELLDEGTFTSDGIRIEGGKIYVGSGGSQVVIDGATGEVIVGPAMVLSPSADGGSIVFGAASVKASGGGVAMQAPNTMVVANSSQAALGYGLSFVEAADGMVTIYVNGSRRAQFDTGGITLTGIPTGTADDVDYWLGATSTGELYRVPKASGGPVGSGLLRWPFPLSLVTKEFDTTDPSYSPPGHRGIDFGAGVANVAGTPIPAAGDGTVLAVGFDVERGNFVILDHGTRDGRVLTTRYYHLNVPSPLSDGDPVVKGQTVGEVGTTGLSTGYHLHFETRYDGVAENPRAVMAVYGE